MSNWNKVFKPIVVLCAICIIITGALAATNNVTAPIIEAATAEAQRLARIELLPDADEFTEVTDITAENVESIYTANNGVGTIITSSAKGYGGDVVVMTAFNPDGTIKQVKVTEQEETKGIGSNVAANSSYWEKYSGLSGKQALVLDQDVDRYSGATISSRALNSAVNYAIAAYNMLP
jgi:electron transport complex protein RnfG